MTSPQFAPRLHPAQAAMRAWVNDQPEDIWKRVEKARMAGTIEPPYYVRHSAVSQVLPARGDLGAWASDVALASGWGAWRMTQGVYRFDPAVYDPIRNTQVNQIPVQILDHMPEWAVFIETPDFAAALTRGHLCQGVLVWRNRLMEDTMDVLMMVFLAGEHDGIDYDREVLVLPLADTLDESIARRIAEAAESAGMLGTPAVEPEEAVALREALPPVLSLLLYLCSEEPDIGGRGIPGNPLPKSTRREGWKLFPANGLKSWAVGTRLGAALRQAYHAAETGQGEVDPGTGRARPRAHIRKAHWHTFLTGAGRSTRALRWLPPIPVNLESVEQLPTTVHEVGP